MVGLGRFMNATPEWILTCKNVDFVLSLSRNIMLEKGTSKIVFPALFQKIDESSKDHCM